MTKTGSAIGPNGPLSDAGAIKRMPFIYRYFLHGGTCIPIAIASITLLLSACVASDGCVLTCAFPEEPLTSGSPIPIQFTIANGTNGAIGISFDYPLFRTLNGPSLVLTIDGDDIEAGEPFFEGRIPILPIPSGGKKSFTMYLGRHLGFVPVGSHSVNLSLHLYDSANGTIMCSASTRGTIDIIPKEEGGDWSRYFSSLANGDFYARQEAAEALAFSLVPDAQGAISALVKAGLSDRALELAASYSNRLTGDLLTSSDAKVAIGALDNLLQSDYRLSPCVLRWLLSQEDMAVFEAIKRHLKSHPSVGLLRIIEANKKRIGNTKLRKFFDDIDLDK